MVLAQELSLNVFENYSGSLIGSRVAQSMVIATMSYRRVCHLEGTRIQELDGNLVRKV